MTQASSRCRAEQLLRELGAHQFPHSCGRTLGTHLLGTAKILRRWRQPDWLCDAGAFHSVYGTEAYREQLIPNFDRRRLRRAIGDRAERVVHLFSSLSTEALRNLIDSIDRGAEPELQIHCRGPRGGYDEHVTRDEVAALLILSIANEAEQACATDRSPGEWLAGVSDVAMRVGSLDLPVPPIFDGCRVRVSESDESAACEAYGLGLESMSADASESHRQLEQATDLLPWVAEPEIWLAYLALQQGDAERATTRARRGWRLLEQWGVAWDKRLSFDQWAWLAEFITGQSSATMERAPLPAPNPEHVSRFPNVLREGRKQKVFFGLRGPEQDRSGDSRLDLYLAGLATNEGDPRLREYPGLPARPWHDADAFPIARALTKSYEAIRAEVLALSQAAFFPESEAIDRTGSWDVLFLFERGRKDESICEACPVTTQILEEHDAVRTMEGLIYVSRLRPGTHVTPHCGPTNMRLRCHLGIEVPHGNCGIRVEGQTRRWVQGGCIVFDDYLEHEAWNHTSSDRIVLIVDLWHRDLQPEEIAVLEGLHRYAAAHAISLGAYWQSNAAARAEARTNSAGRVRVTSNKIRPCPVDPQGG